MVHSSVPMAHFLSPGISLTRCSLASTLTHTLSQFAGRIVRSHYFPASPVTQCVHKYSVAVLFYCIAKSTGVCTVAVLCSLVLPLLIREIFVSQSLTRRDNNRERERANCITSNCTALRLAVPSMAAVIGGSIAGAAAAANSTLKPSA